MLSVQPLKSAKAAADYYAAAFDYYSGDAQAMRWLGSGCQRLNLEGRVEKEQFLKLLEGRLPSGQVLQNKLGEHRPGFDMTFSAPKSVSILVALGADYNLERLHDLAVVKAISSIEKEFAQARVVIDGKVHYVNTDNLVIAAFRQPSSRANDPDVHTHAVTMNLTFTTEDLKARSLASDIHAQKGVIEQLQRYVTYAGLLYRTELANLMKENGYRLRDIGKGLFEIDGFPKALLKEFSTRRHDIEAKMAEEGWEGSRLASRATLLTRNTKEEHDISALRADWESRATQLGFNAHDFVRSHLKETTPSFFEALKEKLFGRFYTQDELKDISTIDAVDVAIETISQKESVFGVRELKEAALRHTLTGKTIVPIEAIDARIQEAVKHQNLYQAVDGMSGETMLATPWALTLETETLARIEANKDILIPIASRHAVEKVQRTYEDHAKFKLTTSQKNAFAELFLSTDRFTAIQGFAGTGKTTMLQLTTQLADEKGITLRGLAVTSSAVNELREKAGIHSDVFEVVHHELRNASDLSKTLYILDEASMLSAIQGHELIKLVEQKGARLCLMGDSAQLSSVKCGRIFGQAQDYGIQTTYMTDIIRQDNAKARSAVLQAIQGDLHDSLQNLDEIRVKPTHEERVAYIAHHWLSLSPSDRNNTLVFAPRHADRREITHELREGLKQEGTLMGHEIVLNTLKPKKTENIQHRHLQYYQEGEMVRFNIQLPFSRIAVGDYLTVGHITAKHRKSNRVPLIHQNGKSVELRLRDLPTHQALNRPIEFYEKTTLPLCVNDKVLVTRNMHKMGLVNSSLAKVKTISEQGLTLVFEHDGTEKTLPLNSDALKHLDHGYVLTNMKVQGKDKLYGLGLIESYNSFSATTRNYYVQISRAISRMTLVTDDKERLLKALEFHIDTKKTALDFVSMDTLRQHQLHFAHPNALSIEDVAEKKTQFDEMAAKKHALIKQYVESKRSIKPALSAKLAFQIVGNADLFRLYRSQYVASESVLRKDSLKLSTLRLIKRLPEEEQQKVCLVKNYLELSSKVHAAWKSVHHGNPGVLQRSMALEYSLKRNAIAHQISIDVETYKPYLEHFSIGKLNRLGMSQHRIAKAELHAVERLSQLSKQAENHQLHLAVIGFFNHEHPEKREKLAFELKSQSKRVHPYLLRFGEQSKRPPDELWRELNLAARVWQDKVFRETLSAKEQILFDEAKQYKALQKEIAEEITSTLYCQATGRETPKEIEEKLASSSQSRNNIASLMLNNPAIKKMMDYFNIKQEALEQQTRRHDKRETVLQFQQQSNFLQKREAARLIGEDIKGHYLYIKELGLNTSILHRFMRVEARALVLEELNEAQKEDYREVMQYKLASKHASALWKSVFHAKEQGISQDEKLVIKAQGFTAKRDGFAASLEKRPHLQAFIEQEKLDLSRIGHQARQHEARCKTILTLDATKQQLLSRFEHIEKMNKAEAKTWHQRWDQFSRDVWRIRGREILYQEALKDTKSSVLELTEAQKNQLNQFELVLSVKNTSAVHLSERLDANAITEALLGKPEETYRAIFGEPKKITSRELRYGSGMIVTLKGSKTGFWYDFSAGEGGGPIQALMRERGLSFQEALQEGASISGVCSTYVPAQKTKSNVMAEVQEEKNKIISAISIVKGGVPISGTLAERYLKHHRHIEQPEKLNVLFWPKGSCWRATDDNGNLYDKINKIPALLIAAKNEKGDVTGVQRIYLDEKTGGKNTFMECIKLSKGKIEGCAGILQKGEKLGTLYLVEGPETGASIAMANPKATVLVSFGLSNLKNLSSLIQGFHPQEVILAGDNDTLSKNNALKATLDAIEILKKDGVDARLVLPDIIQGRDKTDWNDVHKIQGLEQVRRQLGLSNQIDFNHRLMSAFDRLNCEKVNAFVNAHQIELYNQNNNLNLMRHGMNSVDVSYHSVKYQEVRAPNSIKVNQMDLKKMELEL